MVQSTKTFRVFVSSTFSDLKEERNALQREVFPKLRELCIEHGFRFQAIDLRWGVSEEAGLDQKTMKICLEEIERSQKVSPKPNFIILLGDRYGWRPVPYEIPADEFEEIHRLVENEDDRELLDEWFRRDDNALPPVYDLQSRTGEYEDYDTWNKVETDLNTVLRKTVSKLDITEEKRQKYFTSATEQEIVNGALRVKDANEHVYCFFREINNIYPDENSKEFINVDNNGNLDKETTDLLTQLKYKLSIKLPEENIYKYPAEWTEQGLTSHHLNKLCEDVYKSLSDTILQEIEQFKEFNQWNKEIIDHQNFGSEITQNFIGKTEILDTIENYLKERESEPLTIYGISGSGKTALMAYAAKKAKIKHPDSAVISRFIGATPTSSDIISLLESLCRQISDIYDTDHSEIPTEYEKLIDEFPAKLSLATHEKPLIIFLDALDQLSDFKYARKLAWLPIYQPKNVHIIVSTIPGKTLDKLQKKFPSKRLIELRGMKPEEATQILDLWLDESSRTLKKDQKDEVLGKFSINGLPLYLKLAFEEAKRWKSCTAKEDVYLGEDIPSLILNTFKRLSKESQHGELMVSKSLCYLTSSRYGLSEDEIIDVLSMDKTILSDFKRRSPRSPDVDKLPVVVWSRLYFDLEPYLTERSITEVSLLNFYHRQFTEVITKEYLIKDLKKTYNLHLADYFDSKKLSKRKVDELPWQLSQAESWERLKECLVDLDLFIEMMDRDIYEIFGYWQVIGDRYNMVRSYSDSLENALKSGISEESLAEYYNQVAKFLELNAHLEEAEVFYRKSLEIYETVLSPNHPETVDNLKDLAGILIQKGNYEEAEILLRRAIEISEAVLGKKNSGTAVKYNTLAVLLMKKGSWDARFYDNQLELNKTLDEAENLLKRTLEIDEAVFGTKHPSTAATLHNLAMLMKIKGDDSNAESLYRRVIEIREEILGPNHPETAKSLNNLATLLDKIGNYDNAESLHRRVIKIREEILGPNHPETAGSLHNLAALFLDKGDKGKYDEAELLLRRALKIYEGSLGPKNPKTNESRRYLSLLLYYNADYDEAEALVQKVMDVDMTVFGPYDKKTIYFQRLIEAIKKNKRTENEKRRKNKSSWKFWK